jgi:excisionase family DNA binding protein
MIKGRGSASQPIQASGTIRAWASLQDDPLLTVRQLVERLGADESTIRRWIHSGKLHAHKVGGLYKCRTSVALEFMGETGDGANEPKM